MENRLDGFHSSRFIAMHGTDGHQQWTIGVLAVSADYSIQMRLFGKYQYHSFYVAGLGYVKGKTLFVFFIFYPGPLFFIAGTRIEGEGIFICGKIEIALQRILCIAYHIRNVDVTRLIAVEIEVATNGAG